MKVIIVRPTGYSGGQLVLDKLCCLLRAKGVDARLFYIDKEPSKDCNASFFWKHWIKYSIKWYLYFFICKMFKSTKIGRIESWRIYVSSYIDGIKQQRLPFIDKENTIVVYPEKVYGNFLKAKHVIRWLLYHYPYSNDKNAYEKTDVFVCFREFFNDRNLNPKGYNVKINHFDNKLYCQSYFGERSGKCYFVRKGAKRSDLPKEFDGPVLDNLTELEKVKALNRYKYCYSYDMQSFYSAIASICGCISIRVLEPGKTKNDYLGEGDKVLGVAYGDSEDEILYAIRTRDELIRSLDFTQGNEEGIGNFFDIVYKEFGLADVQ